MAEEAGLSKEQEEHLSDCLTLRVYEAGVYLGLPERYEIEYEHGRPNKFCEELNLLQQGLNFLRDSGLFATANHSARVALDCVVLSDILGIGPSSDYAITGTLLVSAAAEHDSGKMVGEISKIAEKQSNFTEKDREKMKVHVGASMLCMDEEVRAVIADHHRWQKTKSYTPFPPLRNELYKFLDKFIDRKGYYIVRTAKTQALSKFLALLDCHDAAATRSNTRNSAVRELPSPEKLMQILLREYGNLRINYSGSEMPKMNFSGQQLIFMLYETGIFGRESPFNPYSKPYSFIRGRNEDETLMLMQKAQTRQKELDIKLQKYLELRRNSA